MAFMVLGRSDIVMGYVIWCCLRRMGVLCCRGDLEGEKTVRGIGKGDLDT